MVFESAIGSNVSPPRPNTLMLNLKKSWVQETEENNNQKIVVQEAESKGKRRKKKRTAVKKFEQLYIPTGENLGQGSQGSVATYRNRLTNIEYAVKVSFSSFSRFLWIHISIC